MYKPVIFRHGTIIKKETFRAKYFMLFKDRKDAGKKLATHLKKYNNAKDTYVLALPRGGVVVAKEVCDSLNLPLDIVVPRKIGAPYNNELAIGAICEDKYTLNTNLISYLEIDETYIKTEIEKEKKEAKRRKEIYRKNKKDLDIKNIDFGTENAKEEEEFYLIYSPEK